MFGRGRRKARTTQVTVAPVEASQPLIEMAPIEVASLDETPAAGPVAPITPAQVDIELDAAFVAMMSQLDESLAAMARACDRIEEAVTGASRHQPAEGWFADAETAAAA